MAHSDKRTLRGSCGLEGEDNGMMIKLYSPLHGIGKRVALCDAVIGTRIIAELFHFP